MHIKKKITLLLEQGCIKQVTDLLDQTSGSFTLWGARAVEHKDYSGEAPLYWVIESISKAKSYSLEYIDAWEDLKVCLINSYCLTQEVLKYEIDIVLRILNFLREFDFFQRRSRDINDFRKFIAESLDTDEYNKKRDVHKMYDDFWKSWKIRTKPKTGFCRQRRRNMAILARK